MKAWQREGPCLKYVTDQYTCSSRHLPSFKGTWVTGGYRVAWEPLKSRADFQQHFSAKETDQPGSQSKSPGLRNKTNYSFGETTQSVPKPKWDMKVTSVIQCVWLFVPRGLQPSRLLCPRNFPGKNTGVGYHFLLQGIFLAQGLNPGLLHCKQMSYLSYQGSHPSPNSAHFPTRLRYSATLTYLPNGEKGESSPVKDDIIWNL